MQVDGAPLQGLPAIGIDLVRVARVARLLRRHPIRFAARVLTEGEQAYVRARPENFAGRWAAKEAVSKVLGLGVRGIGWREIEIGRVATGEPAVRLHGAAAERAAHLEIAAIAVSITHEREYAVAVALGHRARQEPALAEA